jgi:5-methylcytosine-specific restriction enzyme A
VADRIPDGITRAHLIDAIRALDAGEPHPFGPSTGYDVLYNGKRYPPKAVVGVAARQVAPRHLGPDDFHGGLGTPCFRTLEINGFEIITKADIEPYPDEVSSRSRHMEGAVISVHVNRFERDAEARSRCIAHYGPRCAVCDFDFAATYGEIGRGFIHVHHIVPLATIAKEYVVDPIGDLRPVCPNCHAMLHKRTPPYSLEQLRAVRSR